MIKKYDLAFIGLSGFFTGLTLSQINDALQFVVLLLTISGIVWRMFNKSKNKR